MESGISREICDLPVLVKKREGIFLHRQVVIGKMGMVLN